MRGMLGMPQSSSSDDSPVRDMASAISAADAANMMLLGGTMRGGRRPRGRMSAIIVSVPGHGLVAAFSPDGDPLSISPLADGIGFGGPGGPLGPVPPFGPVMPMGTLDGAPLGSSPSSVLEELMSNPGVMSHIMRANLEQMLRMVIERSFEEQRQNPTVPPANESTRDALPRVVVTKEDLIDDTNSKCPVCFEEYKAGARATRMFCGHLFCTACIREWLRTANSCPVCRYELATDSQEYEEGRKERMRGRTVKLKEGELCAMRVPELKRVMGALGISGEGCLEKADLIRRLGSEPGVELAPDRLDLRYEEKELGLLDLSQLHSLAERHQMPRMTEVLDESGERAELMRRFASAGWLVAASATDLPLAIDCDSNKGHTLEALKVDGAVATSPGSTRSKKEDALPRALKDQHNTTGVAGDSAADADTDAGEQLSVASRRRGRRPSFASSSAGSELPLVTTGSFAGVEGSGGAAAREASRPRRTSTSSSGARHSVRRPSLRSDSSASTPVAASASAPVAAVLYPTPAPPTSAAPSRRRPSTLRDVGAARVSVSQTVAVRRSAGGGAGPLPPATRREASQPRTPTRANSVARRISRGGDSQ